MKTLTPIEKQILDLVADWEDPVDWRSFVKEEAHLPQKYWTSPTSRELAMVVHKRMNVVKGILRKLTNNGYLVTRSFPGYGSSYHVVGRNESEESTS